MSRARIVTLKFRRRLFLQDKRVDAVYFPLTSMISLLVSSPNTRLMEMATIGREGVAGASELIHGQGAMGVNLIQIAGAAVRVDRASFLNLVDNHPALRALMSKHLYALMRQILYGAACNNLHSMEERCARWLLMTHDRASSDTFPLTQEFLSHMLGVRRATVNVATGMLKNAGFIRYVRGRITVVNRPGLESASCECYRAITRVYDSVLSDRAKR